MKLFARFRRSRSMDCAEVGELLQFYLDGELDEARSTKLAEHLDACLQCGLDAEAYQRIKLSLAARGAAPEHDPALKRLRSFADELVNRQRQAET